MYHRLKIFFKQSILIFVFSIFMINTLAVSASDLRINLNKGSVYQNEILIISGSGGTPNGIFTFWIRNSLLDIIWAVQDKYSNSGEFEYKLVVPSNWETGNYTVYLRDFSTEQITIEQYIVNEGPPPLPIVKFEVNTLIVEPMVAEPNEEVTVTATIVNAGEVTAEYLVELEMDDEIIETERITLNVGEFKTVSFVVSSDIEGNHIIEIGNLFEVFTISKPSSQSFSISWVIIDVTIIVVAIAAVYYLRKNEII